MTRKSSWKRMMIYPEDLEDDSDASYGMESSLRSHNTYSSTPNQLPFLLAVWPRGGTMSLIFQL